MTTTVYGIGDDPGSRGVREHIIAREAGEAAHRQMMADLAEQQRPQREAEAAAMAEARETARQAPPLTAAQQVSADIRQAATGGHAPQRQAVADSIAASTRELLAIGHVRSQARDITGGN